MFKLFRQAQSTLRIKDVVPHVEEALSKEIAIGNERMKIMQAALRNDFLALEGHVNELGARRAEGFTEAVRQRFCDGALGAIGSIPKAAEWDSFLASAEQSLLGVSRVSMKEFRHLQAFRSEMSRIAVKVKAIESNIDEMKKAAETYKLAGLKQLRERVGDVKRTEDEIAAAKKERIEIEGAASLMAKRAGQCEEESNALGERIESRDESSESKEREAAIIRQKLASELAIGRAMKKLMHAAELGKADMQLAERYSRNAADAFLGDSDAGVKRLLQKAAKLDACDASEKERVLNAMRKLDFLGAMRTHHEALRAEIEEEEKARRAALASVIAKKKAADESLDEARRELERLGARKAATASRIKELEKAAEEKRASLEAVASSLCGRKISIKDS